jgi:isoquinoline 1-oxidoreductase subunit beta
VGAPLVVTQQKDSYERTQTCCIAEIEVHILPSDKEPAGLGEPGVPPLAPAVANAVICCHGKRPRRLPIDLALLARNAQKT